MVWSSSLKLSCSCLDTKELSCKFFSSISSNLLLTSGGGAFALASEDTVVGLTTAGMLGAAKPFFEDFLPFLIAWRDTYPRSAKSGINIPPAQFVMSMLARSEWSSMNCSLLIPTMGSLSPTAPRKGVSANGFVAPWFVQLGCFAKTLLFDLKDRAELIYIGLLCLESWLFSAWAVTKPAASEGMGNWSVCDNCGSAEGSHWEGGVAATAANLAARLELTVGGAGFSARYKASHVMTKSLGNILSSPSR
mmetsp:Transcript_32932/g.64610  ORF Transcript_32932/g.64610 Transcript_32932/m.64610 type:complete len:249 (-) Transcript_32932:277-1023(-)